MSDYERIYNKECETVQGELFDFDHVAISHDKSELILPEGKLKRIHINQHVIRANSKSGPMHAGWKPPVTVKTSDANHKGWSVDIHGVSSVVYRPNKPLNCGAKVWVETTAAITLSLTPQ
jgi:hypothetical protein